MAAPTRRRAPQIGANQSLPSIRAALSALVREQRAAVLMAGTGNDRANEASQRFRQQFLDGMRAVMPQGLLTLDVMPDAIWYADHPALEATERRGDFVEALYAEGIRSIAVEPEATDRELNLLAEILLINWADRKEGESDLRALVQESDLTRIRLEILDRLQDKEATGDSPAIARIEAMIEALESEADGSGVSGSMRQDEVEILLRVRGGMGEQHDARETDIKPASLELPPRLEEEIQRIGQGKDLEGIADLLGRCLEVLDDPAAIGTVGRGLADWIVRSVEAAPDAEAAWTLLELLDPACTPDFKWRGLLQQAMVEFSADDQLQELRRSVPEEPSPALLGHLFSLGAAVTDPAVLHALAAALPSKAVRALADAVVLREQAIPAEGQQGQPEGDLFHHIRARVLSEDYGANRLGLAMSARVEDARFGELLLSLTFHVSGQIRQEALYALRNHPTSRLRARVHELFTDPEEVVRLEVLRHAVASRDQQLARRVEARLQEPGIAQASDNEIRALCISLGKILKSEADPILLAFALGQKASPHPHAARLALQGLKASGGRGARNALQRVVTESPRLATEAESLLRGMGA